MRIAQITFRYAAPGGVENEVAEMARRLPPLGDRVTVYAGDLYDEGQWVRHASFPPMVDGTPVQWFPVRKRLIPGLTLPLMLGLMRALDSDAPDLIHAHSHRYGHVLESATVSREREIPLVVTLHYHPAHVDATAWVKGLHRVQDHFFGMTAYHIADAVIVQTQQELRIVSQFVAPHRLVVIPPGINYESWTSPETVPLPPELPARYLLFAGRVAPNKGLPFLIDALGRVPANRRIPLVIMGRDWGEAPALKERARAVGIESEVLLLGEIKDQTLYRSIMRRAAAFILPSQWEAFGIVLVEAMACSVPVIASSVGGMPEVLDRGRAGLLVPYGDEAALAGAIEETLANPGDAEKRIEVGRAQAKRFTWQHAAEQHHVLYERLAGAA
ncbi:MAG: glycosyltransferase family 4 protein [Thermoplasmata archaeon]